MNAIRVRKRGGPGRAPLYAVHLLDGPGRTMCGRDLAELQVEEHLALDSLPVVEGCNGCRRRAEGWTPPPRPKRGTELRIVLPPAPGRLRTTGSLGHGFNRHRARRVG